MDNVYPKISFGEETSEIVNLDQIDLDANVGDIPED
jgi:hypothetical protein